MKKKPTYCRCSVNYACMTDKRPSLDSEMEKFIVEWMANNSVVEIKFSIVPQIEVGVPI